MLRHTTSQNCQHLQELFNKTNQANMNEIKRTEKSYGVFLFVQHSTLILPKPILENITVHLLQIHLSAHIYV